MIRGEPVAWQDHVTTVKAALFERGLFNRLPFPEVTPASCSFPMH